jgi:predicted GTPase
MSFEAKKHNIEKINLKKSKEYITKLIANKFVKEFDNEEGKKNPFTIALIDYMKKFIEEYMEYCSKFIKSFKANLQKTINEFNVNDNKILIEHINFIVIGKAGVGKSIFINESLLLPEGKRAKEGMGQSVTDKSSVYESEKLKMVRMWDTQGLDYKISQEFILNEIKRIVENGLNQGPDHYINIILYCTTGERFQDEDAKLIYEIMKIYPSDNLPVIITQLQAYFSERAKKMQEIIRKILSRYLDKSISDKIEIRDIVAREERGGIEVFKARGIPELLTLSVKLMGRSITSATCKKFSQEIEKLCKNYVEKQINFIEKQFKYEMEILDVSKSMYVEDMEGLLENSEKKKIKTLSEMNIYSKIEDKKYFEENFIKIMETKFFDIYNHLNDIDILNEEKEDQANIQENAQ